MVPAKPWKADAIIRLVLGVMICAYAGSVLLSVLHYAGAGAKVTSKLFFPLAAVTLACLAATLALIRKTWQPEFFSRRLVALVVCAYGGLLLGAWVQRFSGLTGAETSIQRMVLATLSFQGAGLVLIACFLREEQSSWAEAFGFSNRWRLALLAGVLGALVFLPIGWGLQQLSAVVMTHLPQWLATHLPHWLTTHLPSPNLQPQEQLPVQALRLSMSWSGRVALGLVAVLLAPVAEEMMFRGILYPAIKRTGHPQLALWVTSLLFGAIHLNLVTFVPLVALALVLTALYEWTNNLLAPILAHLLFNAVNFAYLLVLQRYGS